MWKRPHLDDLGAARRAFDLACEEVAPKDIVDSARRWVEAYEPRYLKSLRSWLELRGWQHPPPERRRRRRSDGKTTRESSGYRSPREIAVDLAEQHRRFVRGGLSNGR